MAKIHPLGYPNVSVDWAFPIIWLHIVAAIFWVGGQLFLVLVVLPVLRQELAEADRVRIVSLAGRRFALLSTIALGVLLVTGSLNAIEHGLSWAIVRDKPWGHLLITKVLLIIVMLCLTGVHGAYYGRRLEQLGAATVATPDITERRRRLHRLIARTPGTQRYRPTQAGLRTALFCSRVSLRVLRPGLTEVLAPLPQADGMLRPSFDTLTAAIDQFLDTTQCAA